MSDDKEQSVSIVELPDQPKQELMQLNMALNDLQNKIGAAYMARENADVELQALKQKFGETSKALNNALEVTFKIAARVKGVQENGSWTFDWGSLTFRKHPS